jgi:hypothetical protein
MRCLDAALYYLSLGWRPLALRPPTEKVEGAGKRPWYRWKRFQHEGVTRSMIHAWWKERPEANVGVLTGPASMLVGVDVDSREGAAAVREAAGGQVEPTMCFRTGRGWRLLYALPAGVTPPPSRWVMAASGGTFEVLSAGRQSVMPPSLHPDGPRYTWLSRPDVRLYEAPGWLWPRAGEKRAKLPRIGTSGPVTEYRNNRLFALACAMRRHGCVEREIAGALRLVNERCSPPLGEAELAGVARSACRYRPGGG